MSETPSLPPSTPSSPGKEVETKKTTNGSNADKYKGDGLASKGKLIGMEDLSIDRDEKVCLDSMFKLKAVVRARGEHKQRIQMNLTMRAVNIIDDTTKAQVATHEIERISFVVIDPRDTRAFGYIYNTTDDRHQFWAIKTERAAAVTVLALKELFELAFEQYTKDENAKGDVNKPVTTPPSSPITPSEQTVRTQAQPPSAPVISQPPSILETPSAAPVTSPPSVASGNVAPATTPSPLDESIWGDPKPSVVAQTTVDPLLDWGLDEPTVTIMQSNLLSDDPLGSFLNPSTTATTTTNQPAAIKDETLLDIFANVSPIPAPEPPTIYTPFHNPGAQPNYLNPTLTLPQQQQQQRPVTPTTTYLQQQDSLSPRPTTPIAPPSVTSPFAGLDGFSGLLSATPNKTTKESFFPTAPPAKTMQQLLLEKQP